MMISKKTTIIESLSAIKKMIVATNKCRVVIMTNIVLLGASCNVNAVLNAIDDKGLTKEIAAQNYHY